MIARVRKKISFRGEEREASVTVAGVEDGPAILVGFAFQSPRDQLNKKIGRDIAKGRIEAGKFEAILAADVIEDDKFQTSKFYQIIEELLAQRRLGGVREPKWLQKFIEA